MNVLFIELILQLIDTSFVNVIKLIVIQSDHIRMVHFYALVLGRLASGRHIWRARVTSYSPQERRSFLRLSSILFDNICIDGSSFQIPVMKRTRKEMFSFWINVTVLHEPSLKSFTWLKDLRLFVFYNCPVTYFGYWC